MLYISSCAVLRDEFDKFIQTEVDVTTHVLCRWLRRPLFTIENARAVRIKSLGSLRYGDYGLRTTAGRALSFVCSTGLSRANIER